MNSNFIWGRADEPEYRAFSRTDLAALIGVVALLSLLVFPVLAREADSAERAVCLNNMQRIMAAVVMYPEVIGEGLSQRHATANGEGLGVVGRSGGTVDFMKSGAFTNLQRTAKKPNDLLCGPGYR